MTRTAITALATILALPAAAEPLKIIALGDMPYGAPEEVYAPFETLIATVNERAPDLVIHIGDTKSGSTPCSDQMLNDQLAYMNTFQAPTIYTPGDNEWTDCHRENAGGFDPIDRLEFIRGAYFAEPGKSFGVDPIEVSHQGDAGYPENTRAMLGDVMVVATHVVGSNNNLEARDLAAVEEFFARNEANIEWLNAAFDAAGDANAVILALHADMFEFDFNSFGNEGWLRHSGFKAFGEALQERASDYGKPVLLVYGDSHKFQVHIPFPQSAPNLTALEVFGAADMHAVEITVDASATAPFGILPVLNPALNAGG